MVILRYMLYNVSYQLWRDAMLTAQLKQNFINDLVFSGWTDTLKVATSRKPKNSYNEIVGEYKDNTTSKKSK